MNIILTQPKRRAIHWLAPLQQLGVRVKHCAAFTIEPVPPPPLASGYHGVVFTSVAAVQHGLAHMNATTWHTTWAVGASTAHQLNKRGYLSRYLNACGIEPLLQLEDFQQITGQRWLLVRGLKGRRLLSRVLRERGAVVDECPVYQRAIPSEQKNGDILQQTDMIVVTCGTAVLHLLRMFAKTYHEVLRTTPLLVPSVRVQKVAQRCGFQTSVCATQPNDDTMLATLRAWLTERDHESSP